MRQGVARMLVPLALPTLLDYRWPAGVPLAAGMWAEIPVGRKVVHGVVAEVLAESPFQGLKEARPMAEVPALAAQTLAFYRWTARYTLSTPGEPLRVALPRAQVPARPTKRNKAKTPLPLGMGAWQFTPVALTAGQQAAVAAVDEGFGVSLLDGVTGSGKTEVYFELVHKVLETGGQALVLVPEIALTPQWLRRFEERFGVAPWVWHSGLADGARRKAWWALASGEAGVVVAARSGLFLPFANLRLVVVDEEHDPSYKQDEAFRYHGRDLAVQLAREWQAPAVLASATPSLESWQRAVEGKYKRIVLPDRFGGAMAPVELVDLRGAGLEKGRFVAPAVMDAVAATVAKGEQALLFLNRRGNAPLLLCADCGVRRDCSRCDATLVVHGDRLQCHHCGLAEAFPDECPACGSVRLVAYGPGTRRVVQEVQQALPEARVAVADSDAVGTPAQLAELVAALETHAVDVVVGTQMVTKGHHFPNLTLVGVVDGDMGLAHGEVRAAERTFQLLTQVAGRAGRGAKAGRVLVQTFDPLQPLFQALVRHDRDGFYAAELAARQPLGAPPFGRQVALVVDGLEEAAVERGAQMLAREYPAGASMRLLGPAPAPLARVRDRYRWRLLLQGPRVDHALVKGWVEGVALPKGVRVVVDVDPVSFM